MLVQSSRKRTREEYLDDENGRYKFLILLPTGVHVDLILHDQQGEMLLSKFIHAVRKEIDKMGMMPQSKLTVSWKSSIYFKDVRGNKICDKLRFKEFSRTKPNVLLLHDGSDAVYRCQNMWDLTPDTDLLSELPAEYTFESALADLIDNSLQAIWFNAPEERKLIRITIDDDKILILDSGQGMDGSDANSLLKWGKMGSSNHRQFKDRGIGGNPPYLLPYFGMYGYGGFVASMHLGSSATVASKTKLSGMVFTLFLSRDALLKSAGSESTWKTGGQIRYPSEQELNDSPHGSFTKCDDTLTTMGTAAPIEFEVNGVNLTEVDGGELAITNLNSCNGPDFVLLLHFVAQAADNSGGKRFANARIKCVYFPILEGKESIERILEELDEKGCGIKENFDNFSRVSIRRLGRLLPDARWGRLPFMEPKLRRGDKVQLLRRCCMRVKCFVETDAGFSPTTHKNDLAHKDPFTVALKNFGLKPSPNESLPTIEIQREGRSLSLSQIEKEYQDWVLQLHEAYDEEVDTGEDTPVFVISPNNKKNFGISSDVIRVHQVIRRKGISWRSGQHVKILKGADSRLRKDLYATLEYILLGGFRGEFGEEASLICRPLDCPEENGCLLEMNDGNSTLDIRGSKWFPVGLIDSGKFQLLDSTKWQYQLEKKRQNAPARIDILDSEQCQLLGIDGALPMKDVHVLAGYIPPREMVAVLRPLSFMVSSSSSELDQKFIVKSDLAMKMEITFFDEFKMQKYEGKIQKESKLLLSKSSEPSSRSGFDGLYIFSLDGSDIAEGLRNSGIYKFSFFVTSQTCGNLSFCKQREVNVFVEPAGEVGKLELLNHSRLISKVEPLCLRVGTCIQHLSVACFDVYSNRMPFLSIPELYIKLGVKGSTLTKKEKLKLSLSSDKMILEIKDLLVKCHSLDLIRPSYEAILEICSHYKSVCVPCQVIPGVLCHVNLLPNLQLESSLRPGDVIHELKFEMLDAYGNHVEKGTETCFELQGLTLQDTIGLKRKVDEHGYVNLSGLVKVTGGYGTWVHLSVFSGETLLFNRKISILERELKLVSVIPAHCKLGSQLENVVFGVVDTVGSIDEEIHGQLHTLTITSGLSNSCDIIHYSFDHGKCKVPAIQLPTQPGNFSFRAFHSRHPELSKTIEVNILMAPKLETVSVSELVEMHQCQYDHKIVPFQNSKDISTFLLYIENDEKKLKQNLEELGKQVKIHEDRLKLLEVQISELEQEVQVLQASSGSHGYDLSDYIKYTKEHVIKQIEGKSDAASCILHKFLDSSESPNDVMNNVVGIVSLLGTVDDKRLSRMLSEYLGEKYLRAIVCKSYAAGRALERYYLTENMDWTLALNREAASCSGTIDKRFFVICLEDISPYSGIIVGSKRNLSFPNPKLPTGEIPSGFLGFAVNMINIDTNHLSSVTSSGLGLRETLFYTLFGELQVYKTRVEMEKAVSILKADAISLDGGVVSRKGILPLGHWEPDILFPVVPSEIEAVHMQLVECGVRIMEAEAHLKWINEEYLKEDEVHKTLLQKFRKKKDKLQAFYEGNGVFLDSFPLGLPFK
ncbi:structural maintenance of chromosomes flexible hinge domain-containing protein GMI1-like isoform X2 [Nymphaea colorata]|uniref:structural maintenance of chromosomes flexible hinge domain-containing protein GMI1-like isoform X2 n=1 Tax=Nymphaea colorata TaxID=210225 RepID=UPI00129EC1FB|nr:structural maintenance of chromosomes flexible hinge domain-containing protein GMI1-like isoform X2 [Nymphaea colorata]